MNPSGYQILRSVVPRSVCSSLRQEGLALLEDRKMSWDYLKWRFWDSPINQPYRRHILKIPMTPRIFEAIKCIAIAHQSGGMEGQPLFSPSARLVELTLVITFQGARPQRTHSDIPPFADGTLHTTWLALQDVTAEMGPTMIYPYSHSAAFTEINQRRGISQRHYDASGEPEYIYDDGRSESEDQKAKADRATVKALGPMPEAVAMTVDAGDAVVMNCKAQHYGSAHRTSKSRCLLNVTFQEDEEVHKGMPRHFEGFTYHLADNLVGKYRAGDFLQ